jgi:hypothetical protein
LEGGGARCTWAVSGPATRVSGEPAAGGDVTLETAVVSGEAALVAWRTASTLERPQTVVTRLVGLDGAPLGDEHVVLEGASVVEPLVGVDLSAAFGRAGVSASKAGRGCVVRPLGADGKPAGAELVVASVACTALAATQVGFDVLLPGAVAGTTENVYLQRVSASGAPLQGPVVLFRGAAGESFEGVDRAPRAGLGFYAAARVRTASGAFVAVRPLDALGGGIGTGQTFLTAPEAPSTVSLAPTDAGVIAAWGGRASHGQVERATLSPTGELVRAPAAVAVARQSVTALHLAPDGMGRALLSWVDHGAEGSAAYVRALDEAGDAVGAPLSLAAPPGTTAFGPAVRVVASGGRAVALIESLSPSAPRRVYAVPLRCAP